MKAKTIELREEMPTFRTGEALFLAIDTSFFLIFRKGEMPVL